MGWIQEAERGEWVEKYTMKEEGKEWRFPSLTADDLELSGENARSACMAVSTYAPICWICTCIHVHTWQSMHSVLSCALFTHTHTCTHMHNQAHTGAHTCTCVLVVVDALNTARCAHPCMGVYV
jgi:hypothetical protein